MKQPVHSYQPVQFGVPGRPYPQLTEITGADGSKQWEIGVLEDATRPLIVHSALPATTVQRRHYAYMPSPDLLPLWAEGWAMRAPGQRKRLLYWKGMPGTGKTRSMTEYGRMRHPEGGIIANCGNRNLEELFYEPVLDLDAGRSVYDKINERLAAGELSRVSRDQLGAALQSDLTTATRIDWDGIAGNGDALQSLLGVLDEVARREGIDAPGNALGLKTREGAIIRAWKEDREVLLDEFDKMKPGTDSRLHEFWSFANGDLDHFTAPGPAGQSFTFRAEELPPGFFVNLTGNFQSDGKTTQDLAESAFSRLRAKPIGKPTLLGWQHHIGRELSGMPVSTIYAGSKARWDAEPERLSEFLHFIRTRGLTPEEIAAIPELSLAMLDHPREVSEAAGNLAGFYRGWQEALDPDSDLYRQQPGLAYLLDEIDEPGYAKMVAVDQRMPSAHIAAAHYPRFHAIPADQSAGYEFGDAWDEPLPFPAEGEEFVGREFGSRLAAVIQNAIEESTLRVGKPKLYDYLMQLAVNHGVLRARFNEATPTGRRIVADLLNLEPRRAQETSDQARAMQALLGDYLRVRFPDLAAVDDETLLPLTQVARHMERMAQELPAADAPDRRSILLPASRIEAGSAQWFDKALVQDGLLADARTPMDVPAEALVDYRTLLATLAMPITGAHNLGALWNHALSNQSVVMMPENDEALAIAEGRSPAKIAITTVVCGKVAGETVSPTLLHLVQDAARGRTLIVGHAIEPGLKKHLAQQGITHVDIMAPSARQETETFLAALFEHKNPRVLEAAKDAFCMRTRVPDAADRALAELLTDPAATCTAPNYVTSIAGAERMRGLLTPASDDHARARA